MKNKVLSPKLRCFVAMAIGRNETDDFFNRILKPTLKSLNIQVRRVDQIQTNDDLDNLIFSELDKCDFVIADLTFARPSVYYEAGYARGLDKRVIYTCREDHFKPSLNDDYGNLKIHFDVLMKNTISWQAEKDKIFSKRLRGRIARTIKPIAQKKVISKEKKQAGHEFTEMPFQKKTNAIINSIARIMSTRVSWGIEGNSKNISSYFSDYNDGNIYTLESELSALETGWIGREEKNDAIHNHYFIFRHSITKSYIESIRRIITEKPLLDLTPLIHTTKKNLKIVDHFCFIAINKSSLTKYQTILDSFSIDSAGAQAKWSSNCLIPGKQIPGVEKIFATSQYGIRYLALMKNKKEEPFGIEVNREGYMIKSEQKMYRDDFGKTTEKRMGREKMIMRYIHISLISGIKSIPDVEARMLKMIQNL